MSVVFTTAAVGLAAVIVAALAIRHFLPRLPVGLGLAIVLGGTIPAFFAPTLATTFNLGADGPSAQALALHGEMMREAARTTNLQERNSVENMADTILWLSGLLPAEISGSVESLVIASVVLIFAGFIAFALWLLLMVPTHARHRESLRAR